MLDQVQVGTFLVFILFTGSAFVAKRGYPQEGGDVSKRTDFAELAGRPFTKLEALVGCSYSRGDIWVPCVKL